MNTAPDATVLFNSPDEQLIPAGTYGKLLLKGGGPKQLAGKVSISKELEIQGNKLFIGEYSLSVRSSGRVVAPSAESYVVTNGSGTFIHEGLEGERVALFPVGTAENYSPVFLRNAGEADDFKVRVSDEPVMNSESLQRTERMMDKVWVVEEETAGGSNVLLSLHWNEEDEPEHFLRTNSFISQLNEGEWVSLPESEGSAAEGEIAETYMKSLENLSSLTAFRVGSKGSLTSLPDDFKRKHTEIKVFPNPIRQAFQLEVRVQNPTSLELQLLNAQGKRVFEKGMQLIPGKNHLDLLLQESLPPGLYYLTASFGGEIHRLKIIKE